MRTRFHENFDRHPGMYHVVHDTETPGKKDGDIDLVALRNKLKEFHKQP